MGKKIDRRRKKTVSSESLAAGKSGPVLTATRRDALVRQVDTAIRLWFFDYDPLSIHLIAMPAYQVLEDLGKNSRKRPRTIKKRVDETGFTTVYDWLRHASGDPHDYVDFPCRVNEQLLWDTTISFEKIFRGRSAYMMTFQAYFVLWLVPKSAKHREKADAFLPDGVSVEQVGSFGRYEFFVKLTEMFAAAMTPLRA